MKTPLLVSLALFPLASQAQIQVTGSGGPYTQNFDSLTNTTPAGSPWADNVTLPGWYANTTFMGYGTNLIFNNAGTSGSGDRALGAELTYPAVLFGARFVNATSSVIGGFSLSYDGEQWYAGGLNPVELTFSYKIFSAGGGSVSSSGGWVTVDALSYDASFYNLSSIAVDGNQSSYRTPGINSSVTGISLAPGQELWIRWSAEDFTDSSAVLAVDNLSVSFAVIPEPAAYTALLGGAMFLLACFGYRRRTAEFYINS